MGIFPTGFGGGLTPTGYPGVGTSLSGNTAGTSGSAIVLAGGNNITLSQSGNTISINGGGGAVQEAVSLSGNTSGTLALVSSGTLILAGGNDITLSQNGQSVTILDGMGTKSQWWAAPGGGFGGVTTGLGPFGLSVNQIVWPHDQIGFFSASQFNYFGSFSFSTSATGNSTHSGTLSNFIGIYSKTGSTLSLASSGSNTYAWSYTSNISTASLRTGAVLVSVPINVNMTPGDYWYNFMASFSTAGNLGATLSIIMQNIAPNANFLGAFAASSSTTNQAILGLGFGASTAALPTSISFGALSGASNAANAFRTVPLSNFVNWTA